MKLTLDELNQLSCEEFTRKLGAVFEHSPWVAERVAAQRPFTDISELHKAMVAVIDASGEAEKMQLICAHPELGSKLSVRGGLTAESSQEQAGAGLSQCSPEEFAILTDLNRRYGEKFGFPFILAVRGHNRQSIISEFTRRIESSFEKEFAENLYQIYRIGLFRLQDLVRS